MAKQKSFNYLKITLPVCIILMVTGSGCGLFHHSSKPQSNDSADAAPPDAGTDAVPSAAAEDPSAGTGTPTAIAEDPSAATPPADSNAGAVPPPPGSTDTAAASPPAAAPDVPPAPMAAAEPPAPSPADTSSNDVSTNSGGTYTVRAGQTLMMIAFENYGDLYKWKDIYEANKDKISNPNAVPAGTVLKIDGGTQVSIDKNGDQYMIKQGDTLGSISGDVYGTKKKWKKLWENNKQLIKDPNKIYAGFYLYYTLTPEEREQYEKRDHQTSPAPLAQRKHNIKGPSPASVKAPAKTQASAAPPDLNQLVQ